MKMLRIFSLALLVVLGVVAVVFAKPQNDSVEKASPEIADKFIKHNSE